MEEIYRHKKQGTQYMVTGKGTLQIEGPHDMAECVIYQSMDDGRVWVRPAAIRNLGDAS